MPPVKIRGTSKPKSTKKTVGRLASYLGVYWPLLIIVFIAVIVSSGAQVAGDSLLKPAVNNYIIPLFNRAKAGENLGFSDFLPFLRLILIMIVIFAFGALATWVNSRLMLFISSRSLYKIRTDLFKQMEKLPLKYYDSHTHGELMSLYTNDIDTLRDMMSQTLPQMFSSLLSVTGVFVMMCTTSLLLTLIVVVTELFMIMFASKFGKLGASAFRDNQKNLAALNGFIEERIEGQKVVKVFNREEKSIEEFNVLNDELCKAGTRANTFGNIIGPVMGNLSHVQYALVGIAGALCVISNGSFSGFGKILAPLSLGALVAFLQYTRSFSRPISMMSQQFNSILNALAGAERIFTVIEEKEEIDDGKVELVNATQTLPSSSSDGLSHVVEAFAQTGEWAWKIKDEKAKGGFTYRKLEGDVEFKDVSFSYVPEKEILHHINLHAKPGKKIALVGSTGSGKTTITNLLTRFYDLEEGKGEITYDGIPLKDISKESLRRSLGMVLQDTHLFTGTIRDNIKYGNLEASEVQVMNAAKLANADSFIRHLEHGYDTVITGDGGNLSQGQRQLLAIARAAVADPPVLILDEATSSIDTRTESLIEKGMNRLMEGRSVFVIAHRLSTVRNADEIIVLEKGNIIERGNHLELMKKKGRYYSLYTGAFQLD